MEKLREKIIECLDQNEDESLLLDDIEQLAKENGKEVYRVLINILTTLSLEKGEAEECWLQIIDQWDSMNNAMDRRVSLRTAVCDYFCTINKTLKNPKVVEIHVFEKTVKDSNYDSLTGLFNRKYFDRALDREIALAKRYDKDLSILFFDIDDFKVINDTYGHQTGDEVLKHIAEIILTEKRTGDIVARYGGEELVVILPYTASVDALVLGERIRQRVASSPLEFENKVIRYTLSGGLASYPVDAREATSLIKYADSALYRAKGSGKNNISLFSKDRRRYLRVKFVREISIKEFGFEETLTKVAESKNICLGGILFEHDEPLAIGTKIQVNIPLGSGEPLLVIGTVVRVETFALDKYDIGMSISFQDLDKAAKTEISKYLARELKKVQDQEGCE